MEKLSGVLFRWAGAKTRIRDEVLEHIAPLKPCECGCGVWKDSKFKRWLSPFSGAGSIELEAMRRGLAKEYVLGDSLPEIPATLRVIQSDLDWLLTELQQFAALPVEQQTQRFLALRNPPKDELRTVQRQTLRFLILQACSFNGLWRQSVKTGYNVPFGRPASFDYAALRQAAELLRTHKPQILCQDFAQTVALAGPGDLVYCDPPYLGTHSAYSSKGFGFREHVHLAHDLAAAKARGAECWVSGSDTQETTAIYGGERFHVEARRSIGCKTASRGVKRELLIKL